MDVDEHIDSVDTLGDMLGQKDKSKKDKFIDTVPTIIQTYLITEKDWPVTNKKAKELEHIIRKCNPPAAALPTLAKGTTVPSLYSDIAHSNEHIIRKCDPPAAALPTLAKGTTVPSLYSDIAHSNDKDEVEILQPFKGAHPKQPKPRGGGKGKQPQQKPKNPTQEDSYNYEDTNNYYHNENYRGQSRGHRPYRGQNTGCSFRGQNFHGKGQRNQNTYQGQYQNDSYQSNNYQGNYLKVIVMVNQGAEAMAMAEAITVVTVGPIIEAMLITNIISIMFMMMSTRWINTVHHALYAVAIITLLNTVLKESTISMILWKR